jgi:hypothetical protein
VFSKKQAETLNLFLSITRQPRNFKTFCACTESPDFIYEFSKNYSSELVVLVDFVVPWGIEYPVVFLPQGLFTLHLGNAPPQRNPQKYPGVPWGKWP